MAPFHIKSQSLRKMQLEPDAALGVFAPLSEQAGEPSTETASEGKGGWRQSDVKRAIGAAEQAGLLSYRVEVSPDGTIAIIVGDPADTAQCDADERTERPLG